MTLAPGTVEDVVALINSEADPMRIKLNPLRFCAAPFGDWGRTAGLGEDEQTLCGRLVFQHGQGLVGCAVDASNRCRRGSAIESHAGDVFWTEAQALAGARAYKREAATADAATPPSSAPGSLNSTARVGSRTHVQVARLSTDEDTGGALER